MDGKITLQRVHFFNIVSKATWEDGRKKQPCNKLIFTNIATLSSWCTSPPSPEIFEVAAAFPGRSSPQNTRCIAAPITGVPYLAGVAGESIKLSFPASAARYVRGTLVGHAPPPRVVPSAIGLLGYRACPVAWACLSTLSVCQTRRRIYGHIEPCMEYRLGMTMILLRCPFILCSNTGPWTSAVARSVGRLLHSRCSAGSLAVELAQPNLTVLQCLRTCSEQSAVAAADGAVFRWRTAEAPNSFTVVMLKKKKGELLPDNIGAIIFDPTNCGKTSMIINFIYNSDVICEYVTRGRHNDIDVFYLSQTYSRMPKQLVRDNMKSLCIFRQDDTNLKYIYKDFVSGEMTYDKTIFLIPTCLGIARRTSSIFTLVMPCGVRLYHLPEWRPSAMSVEIHNVRSRRTGTAHRRILATNVHRVIGYYGFLQHFGNVPVRNISIVPPKSGQLYAVCLLHGEVEVLPWSWW
ncbi:hypothetical protein PR048_002712 [Dryococelus australis]|uniref:Uncharacterized protein n=1 Tax=Dryococelus australis TaxID=614101 RepID=A0ABQ9IM20_9NEOP|nr:hypothetical protein PR048_002712 [Dryococelus australis]